MAVEMLIDPGQETGNTQEKHLSLRRSNISGKHPCGLKERGGNESEVRQADKQERTLKSESEKEREEEDQGQRMCLIVQMDRINKERKRDIKGSQSPWITLGSYLILHLQIVLCFNNNKGKFKPPWEIQVKSKNGLPVQYLSLSGLNQI